MFLTNSLVFLRKFHIFAITKKNNQIKYEEINNKCFNYSAVFIFFSC